MKRFDTALLLAMLPATFLAQAQEPTAVQAPSYADEALSPSVYDGATVVVSGIEQRPWLVVPGETDSVKYLVRTEGDPSAVTLSFRGIGGPELKMFDDGTNGDESGGDGTFTIDFAADDIVSLLAPEDIYRPFVGFANLYDGAQIAVRANVFAAIMDESIPILSVDSLALDVQAAEHIVNIYGDRVTSQAEFSLTSWTQRFYELFEDDFDFLNILLVPGFSGNRFHVQVKEDVAGISGGLFDNTSSYGSAGRLQGINAFPLPGLFDLASGGFVHEMGHRWANHLQQVDVLNGVGAHWPYSDMANGVIGISIGGAGPGGTFPYRIVPVDGGYNLVLDNDLFIREFSDLSLYLMGLIPTSAVKPMVVFLNQVSVRDSLLTSRFIPDSNSVILTIEEIVQRVGNRVPDRLGAQKHFRLATILVSEIRLTDREMSFYDFFAARAEIQDLVRVSEGFRRVVDKPFYSATKGLATLDASLRGTETTVLGRPPDMAIDEPLIPTLRWRARGDASRYHLQVGLDSLLMARIVDDSTLSERSYVFSDSLDSQSTYFWRVRTMTNSSWGTWSQSWRFTTTSGATGTAVFDDPDRRTQPHTLYANFPNPFGVRTTIVFDTSEPTYVTLSVFDIGGRRIRTVEFDKLPAGRHEYEFDASILPSGTYFYRLDTPSASLSRRMIVVR